MAGYNDTKAMIISTLMGRPAGTEIQPENQQAYELNMLDYIRSLELISSSPIIGVADETTTPVQPDDARVSYIAGIAQNRTVTFQNFIGQDGQPLSITTSDMEAYLVILLWNAQYWTMQAIPTNIVSSAENANFYYNYNIRKTYASVASMNSDSENPIGTDGKPISVGDIVSVVNTLDDSENAIYSRTEEGWQFQSGMNFALVQETGNNPNVAMSQKATTEAIHKILYDVSANNAGAVFESLSTLLGSANLSTLIPTSVRHGGMSIRFVQSSDNKYVQYRLMNNAWSTTVTDWQGVDDEPTPESDNLVKSGGVYNSAKTTFNKLSKFIPTDNLTDEVTDKTLLFDNNSEYIDGLLNSDGSILSGYNGHTSDFISVDFGDIIMVRGGYNFDRNRPIILGYDSNKLNPTIIATGKDNYLEYRYSDITGYWYLIPYNIKYIRLSSNRVSFEFYKVSLFDAFNDKMEVKNYLKGYYDKYRGTRTGYLWGRVVKNNSEYIEVYEGMTIFAANFVGWAQARGVALYDSTKTFIKSLEISYDFNVSIFFYTFTKEDIDSGIKYLKCESQVLRPKYSTTEEVVNDSFFYIIDDSIEHFTNIFPILFKQMFFQSSLIRQFSNDLNTVVTRIASGTVTKISETEVIITSNFAYVEFGNTAYKPLYKGFERIYFIHLRVSDISGIVSIKKHTNNSLIYADNLTEDADVYILQYGSNVHNTILIQTNGGELPSAKIEVKDFISADVDSNIFNNAILTYMKGDSGLNYYGGFFFSNIENFINSYKENNVGMNAQISLYAEKALESYEMQTHSLIKNKHYVCFGTSITEGTYGGYAPYIAKFFNLELKNLGVSGSVPHGPNGSLRDERLALIPDDSVLCTICYGANGWVHSDDIESRDTNNSIGAINHAIDYIQQNIPKCVIVLGLDYGGPKSVQCSDIKDIAENRHIFYAPTDYIDGPLIYNPETGQNTWRRTIGLISYDGVHLNVLGNLRMASAFINTISKTLPMKGVF